MDIAPKTLMRIASLDVVTTELQETGISLGNRFQCLCLIIRSGPRCEGSGQHFMLLRKVLIKRVWAALKKEKVSEKEFVHIIRSKFCGYHDDRRFLSYRGFFERLWRKTDSKAQKAFLESIGKGLRDIVEDYGKRTPVHPEDITDDLNSIVENREIDTSQPFSSDGSPQNRQVVLYESKLYTSLDLIREYLGIEEELPEEPPTQGEKASEQCEASPEDTLSALDLTTTSSSSSSTESLELKEGGSNHKGGVMGNTKPALLQYIVADGVVEKMPRIRISNLEGPKTPTLTFQHEVGSMASSTTRLVSLSNPKGKLGLYNQYSRQTSPDATGQPRETCSTSPNSVLDGKEAASNSPNPPVNLEKASEDTIFARIKSRNVFMDVEAENRSPQMRPHLSHSRPQVFNFDNTFHGLDHLRTDFRFSFAGDNQQPFPRTQQEDKKFGSYESPHATLPNSTLSTEIDENIPGSLQQCSSSGTIPSTPPRPPRQGSPKSPLPPIDSTTPNQTPSDTPQAWKPTTSPAQPREPSTVPRRNLPKENFQFVRQQHCEIASTIRGILRQPIDEGNMGFIYVLKAPRFFETFPPAKDQGEQWIKIGISRNVSNRIKSLKAQCGFVDLVACGMPFGEARPMEHLRRIERVCHAELINFGRRLDCKESITGTSRCDVVHTEWFAVHEDYALQIVKRWMLFLSQGPYKPNGLLTDFWGNMVSEGEYLQPDEDEHWDEKRSDQVYQSWLDSCVQLQKSAKKDRMGTPSKSNSQR